MDASPEQALLLDALASMLECTLATYDTLLRRKETSMRELDRHEGIIDRGLRKTWKILADYRLGEIRPTATRLDELLTYIRRERSGPSDERFGAGLNVYLARARLFADASRKRQP